MFALVLVLVLVPAALPAPPAGASTRLPRYAWPLAPPHPVLRAFHAPHTEYGAGHRGVDLGAPPDTPVLAAGDAVVVFAGAVATRDLVSLSHAGGLRTTYEPVKPLVSRGQRVTRGTPIGTLRPGHEGCPTTCLHWGAYRPTLRGRTYLDPLKLLTPGRTRLLPLTPADLRRTTPSTHRTRHPPPPRANHHRRARHHRRANRHRRARHPPERAIAPESAITTEPATPTTPFAPPRPHKEPTTQPTRGADRPELLVPGAARHHRPARRTAAHPDLSPAVIAETKPQST
ncbi:M23 family metallopeptidase [Saccharothrix australiensis]|nr:peptidoglycan DD-metalloendopeptidase family protein [Saccharothrix australiensis]